MASSLSIADLMAVAANPRERRRGRLMHRLSFCSPLPMLSSCRANILPGTFDNIRGGIGSLNNDFDYITTGH